MSQARRVIAGAAVAAAAFAGTVVPAWASTAASAVPTAARAACTAGAVPFRAVIVTKAVDSDRVVLRTTCALKAPLTLFVTPVGSNARVASVVWTGSNGVVKDKAVGVFTQTARNFKAGHAYALGAQKVVTTTGATLKTHPFRFVVQALGKSTFVTSAIDKRTKTVHTTGQTTVLNFATGKFVKHGGPVLGYYREGTKGAYKRDTVDPAVKHTASGKTSWSFAVRCGTWEYRIEQPDTAALYSLSTNYVITTRVC